MSCEKSASMRATSEEYISVTGGHPARNLYWRRRLAEALQLIGPHIRLQR